MTMSKKEFNREIQRELKIWLPIKVGIMLIAFSMYGFALFLLVRSIQC